MPTPPTPKSLVLVVGAGASKEANLPTGDELKSEIAGALDIRFQLTGRPEPGGDPNLSMGLRLLASSETGNPNAFNDLLHVAWRIRDGMPHAASIDTFIDSHRSDERIARVGKLAIASCILAAEARTGMRISSDTGRPVDLKGLVGTWYNRFFRLLVAHRQKEELAENLKKVAIVSFNYDRSIEQYMHLTLQTYYGITFQEASSILGALDIYHPYGTVGTLPWQPGASAMGYGETPNPPDLLVSARALRTFTEGTASDTSDIVAIRELMASGKQVVFLGFAFHTLNMQLLFAEPGRTTTKTRRPVYATALGISKSDSWAIANYLHNVGFDHDNLSRIRSEVTCAKLFDEYSRALALV